MNVHVKHSSNEDMHILKKKDLDLYIYYVVHVNPVYTLVL
jgi:hypothetical protein